MKVEMTQDISGHKDGKRWPKCGECCDLPADEAKELIAQGYAKKCDHPEPEKVERATAAPGEKRKTKRDR